MSTDPKPALYYRFYDLFRDPTIASFLCSDSTVDLNQALNDRKIICFGFTQPDVSEEAISTISQFINAYLISFAMKRKKGKARFPIHVMADECDYVVTHTIKKMLKESRKYGLYLTLATQDINDLGIEIGRTILTNVGTFLIGSDQGDGARIMAEAIPDLTTDYIKRLEPLNFFHTGKSNTPPIRTRIDYIGDNFALKKEAWKAVLDDQKQYYPLSQNTSGHYDQQKSAQGNSIQNNQRPQSTFAPKYTVLNIATKNEHD